MSDEITPAADAAPAAEATPEPSEDTTPAVAQNTDTVASDDTTEKPSSTPPTEHMIPKARLDDINAKYKAAQAKVKEFETAQAKAEADSAEAERLKDIEQGEYKEAYKKLEKEVEKANAKAAEEAELRKQAEIAALKSAAVSKHGLPTTWADRLKGETEDDIEADAAEIAKTMPKPIIPTSTDGGNGINGNLPTPGKTDVDIREEAANLGVDFDHLKQHYIDTGVSQNG